MRQFIQWYLLNKCLSYRPIMLVEYRNMIKTMTATSFNRRPDSQSPDASTQATTSSFAARPVIVDRTGGKKSVFGGLRKNTTWEPRVLSWIGWGGWWFIWDVISVLCVLCWSIVALATDHSNICFFIFKHSWMASGWVSLMLIFFCPNFIHLFIVFLSGGFLVQRSIYGYTSTGPTMSLSK